MHDEGGGYSQNFLQQSYHHFLSGGQLNLTPKILIIRSLVTTNPELAPLNILQCSYDHDLSKEKE